MTLKGMFLLDFTKIIIVVKLKTKRRLVSFPKEPLRKEQMNVRKRGERYRLIWRCGDGEEHSFW